MAKTIMILGASILQLPAIEKAAGMGLNVIALDMNPDAIGFKVPGIISEVISTTDIPGAIEAAKKYHIDGVMTLATDMPMRTVAAVAEACGLVGISCDTAIRATDKAVMRKALKQAGVPVPDFHVIASESEFLQTTKDLPYQYMVKPADSSGSRGVSVVKDARDSIPAYRYAKSFSRNGLVVVEEQMIGPEVSVETLAVDGEVHVIQITDKITTGAPHFVEMGHTQPSRLDEQTQVKIKEISVKANQAIGIQNGPSHTEIIITSEGPKIVELGARLGGDCITTHLVPLSTGVDMVEACILIALGEKPNIKSTMTRGSAIRYFAQHAGTIKNVDINKAENMPGVKQISVVHGIGEKITDIIDSGSRMGFVITQGIDATQAAKIAEDAINQIKVEIA